MSNFSERLKELRKERNISQKALADAIGMSDTAIQNYELCTRKPSAETVVLIADYFNVSMDYLMGRTNDHKRH